MGRHTTIGGSNGGLCLVFNIYTKYISPLNRLYLRQLLDRKNKVCLYLSIYIGTVCHVLIKLLYFNIDYRLIMGRGGIEIIDHKELTLSLVLVVDLCTLYFIYTGHSKTRVN
jgi:hypothetical protein